MTARDFTTADNAVSVEQFNNFRKQGCIVRWDFEAVKNQVPTTDPCRSRCGNPRLRSGAAGENTEPQYVEQETDLVAFSVKVYPTLPTADEVAADIESDLAARYPDGNRPTIDVGQYRVAIENLHNLKHTK